MSDQLRWFKLWYSAGSDDRLSALPPETRWAWAILGAHTCVHGKRGVVNINHHNAVLAAAMGVTAGALVETLRRLPHITLTEGLNSHGETTVTWDNWPKFQSDTTQAFRQRMSRSKRRGDQDQDQDKDQPSPTATSESTSEPEPPNQEHDHQHTLGKKRQLAGLKKVTDLERLRAYNQGQLKLENTIGSNWPAVGFMDTVRGAVKGFPTAASTPEGLTPDNRKRLRSRINELLKSRWPDDTEEKRKRTIKAVQDNELMKTISALEADDLRRHGAQGETDDKA